MTTLWINKYRLPIGHTFHHGYSTVDIYAPWVLILDGVKQLYLLAKLWPGPTRQQPFKQEPSSTYGGVER